jgi:hypothetical protein
LFSNNPQENAAESVVGAGLSGRRRKDPIRPGGGAAPASERSGVIIRPLSACSGKRKHGFAMSEQGGTGRFFEGTGS